MVLREHIDLCVCVCDGVIYWSMVGSQYLCMLSTPLHTRDAWQIVDLSYAECSLSVFFSSFYLTAMMQRASFY